MEVSLENWIRESLNIPVAMRCYFCNDEVNPEKEYSEHYPFSYYKQNGNPFSGVEGTVCQSCDEYGYLRECSGCFSLAPENMHPVLQSKGVRLGNWCEQCEEHVCADCYDSQFRMCWWCSQEPEKVEPFLEQNPDIEYDQKIRVKEHYEWQRRLKFAKIEQLCT